MDALSDVLRAVRLTGAIFFEIRAAEPWVAETPAGASIVGSIFPGTQHLIPYHVVTHGSCWGSPLDEPPIHLSQGDIIVFPHGAAHFTQRARGYKATLVNGQVNVLNDQSTGARAGMVLRHGH